MALMTLPYNRTLEFTNGHILRFRKGKPTNVPEDLVENIIERGGKIIKAARSRKQGFDDSAEQEELGKITLIQDAITRLGEEGDPKNLTGTGEVSVEAARKAVAPMPMTNALFTKAKNSMPEYIASKKAATKAEVKNNTDNDEDTN